MRTARAGSAMKRMRFATQPSPPTSAREAEPLPHLLRRPPERVQAPGRAGTDARTMAIQGGLEPVVVVCHPIEQQRAGVADPLEDRRARGVHDREQDVRGGRSPREPAFPGA